MSDNYGAQLFEVWGGLALDSSTRVFKFVGTAELDGNDGEVYVSNNGTPFYHVTIYDFKFDNTGLGILPDIAVDGNKINWHYPPSGDINRKNCKGTLFYGFY